MVASALMLRLTVILAALWPASAWAQAENVAKGVDLGVHAATNIADQGGLIGSIAIAVGCLSLLLHGAQGWAIVSLYKANQALQEKRATEATESTKQVATTAVAGANAIMTSNERSQILEQRTQALAERIGQLAERVGTIGTDNANLMRGLESNGGKMDTLLGRPVSQCRAP